MSSDGGVTSAGRLDLGDQSSLIDQSSSASQSSLTDQSSSADPSNFAGRVSLAGQDFRRILIHGVTGSGKSTLALQLGEITGIPVRLVDDEIGWLPGWQSRPVEEMKRIAEEFAAEPTWIFDSAYRQFREPVRRRAELLICLDYPRWLSLSRLLRRTLSRVITQETSCNGNVESWASVFSKDSIIRWHFQSFKRKRAQMRAWAKIAQLDPAAPRVVTFTSPLQAERWLKELSS